MSGTFAMSNFVRTIGNSSLGQVELCSSVIHTPLVLPELQRATTVFLWHPVTFFNNAVLFVWALVNGAPPTLKLLLTYLVIHRLFRWILIDYQAYLDLGRGGTPSDLWGWWRVTRLQFMASTDVLEPPHVPPMLEPYRGALWSLPKRDGKRPIVKGVAPQRQIDQKTPASTFDTLVNMITDVAREKSDLLVVKTSTLEKHTAALKVKMTGPIELPNTDGEFGFEVCHPHRNDGSLHMIMHPEDIKTVIEAGWGQRHPLATSRWYWRLWYHHIRGMRLPVPEYLVLIYAPRNSSEIAVVKRLLEAAIWFKTNNIAKRAQALNASKSPLSSPGYPITCASEITGVPSCLYKVHSP